MPVKFVSRRKPEAILRYRRKRKFVSRKQISKKREEQKREIHCSPNGEFEKYSKIFKEAIGKEIDNQDALRDMRERRKQKSIKKRALRSKQFNRVRDIRKQDIRNLWEAVNMARHTNVYSS